MEARRPLRSGPFVQEANMTGKTVVVTGASGFIGKHIVKEASGQILVHATRPEVRGMEPCTGDALIKLHQLLPLLEEPENRCNSANIKGICRYIEKMIEKVKRISRNPLEAAQEEENEALAEERMREAELGIKAGDKKAKEKEKKKKEKKNSKQKKE